MNPTNLSQYYTSKGQALPSVQQRQGIATSAGISNYTGTAQQNVALLANLQKGTPAPTPTPTPTPAPAPTPTPALTTNPVITSNATSSNNAAITTDVTNLTNAQNNSSKLLQDQMDALEQRRKDEVAGITASYERALADQGIRQGKDYAGTSTNLVTAGGGFLGFTGSQSGVLQNLKATFEQEKGALMSKKDATIREAQNAIDDKQFALAKTKAQEATSYEKDLIEIQNKNAEQTLAVSRENRSQQEYERKYTDEKIKAYSAMSDEDFSKLTTKQLEDTDRFLYAGATKDLRNAAISSAKNASYKSNLALRSTLQTLINKTPYGQKIPLPDGSFAVGLKTAGGVSIRDPISSSLANQLGSSLLAGKSTKDIILQLEIPNAPDWYKQIYASQNPDGWQQVKNNPNAIDKDWYNYRTAKSFDPFKQTVDITKTTLNQKKSRFEQIQAGNPDTIIPTTSSGSGSDPDEVILDQ